MPSTGALSWYRSSQRLSLAQMPFLRIGEPDSLRVSLHDDLYCNCSNTGCKQIPRSIMASHARRTIQLRIGSRRLTETASVPQRGRTAEWADFDRPDGPDLRRRR